MLNLNKTGTNKIFYAWDEAATSFNTIISIFDVSTISVWSHVFKICYLFYNMYVIHLYEIQAAYNKKVDLIFVSFYIKRKGYLLEMTKKYFPWGKKKKVFPLYPLLL